MNKRKTKVSTKLTSDMLPDECCAKCCYWLYGSLSSRCRRAPPQVIPHQFELADGRVEVNSYAEWPASTWRDWCGEYVEADDMDARLTELSLPGLLDRIAASGKRT